MQLTNLEEDVLVYLIRGFNNQYIANELDTSVTKVSETVVTLFNKYKVLDRIRLKQKIDTDLKLNLFKENILKDKNKFIIIQGNNGSGKTKLIHKISEHLNDRIINYIDKEHYENDNVCIIGKYKDKNVILIDYPIDLYRKSYPEEFDAILSLDWKCIFISTKNINYENLFMKKQYNIYNL